VAAATRRATDPHLRLPGRLPHPAVLWRRRL